MRRRAVLTGIAGAVLAPAMARAQQKRMPVVGYLGLTTPGLFAGLLTAFHQGLSETGYVEGKNVTLEYRWAEGRGDQLPALAAELVARNPDVIATHGGAVTARAVRDATSTIPIVFETGIDPVAAGLVGSMARPGGNLTGISILTSELNPKRLELLSEMVPQALVVAMLINPKNASTNCVIDQMGRAAESGGMRLEVVTASAEDEYEPAFASPAPRPARCSSATTRSSSAITSGSSGWRRGIRSRRSTSGASSSRPAG